MSGGLGSGGSLEGGGEGVEEDAGERLGRADDGGCGVGPRGLSALAQSIASSRPLMTTSLRAP